MPDQNRTLRPAPHPRLNYLVTEQGQRIDLPEGWECLKPGDAAVTRALKAQGPCWTVQRKKGRRTFSEGVWAPAARIDEARRSVAAKRADPAYAKRRAGQLARRAQKQAEYEKAFQRAVIDWLAFHPVHRARAEQMARAIARRAAPIGSGTVARTERILIEQRAQAATIAWMRHQTTAYDHMRIARVRGERRAVRRALAEQSIERLAAYRRGDPIPEACPLARALDTADERA